MKENNYTLSIFILVIIVDCNFKNTFDQILNFSKKKYNNTLIMKTK